jgi:hypothetical protein
MKGSIFTKEFESKIKQTCLKALLFALSFLLFNSTLNAQRKTKLNTNGQGTLFGGVNYNRSYYSNSKLQLKGPQFEFSLTNTPLSDTPSSNSSYFDNEGLEYFQFNAQIGYFIKNKWALSLGFDRLNFFTPRSFTGQIDGVIAPDASSLEGEYNNDEIAITDNEFYYAQKTGSNLVHLGLHRMDQLYKSKKAIVEVLSYTKVGAGAIFSNVDFTFNQATNQQITSLNGIGFNASAGLRTVFWQTIYLQFSFTGGILNQRNIDLGQNRSLRHVTPYFSPEIGIGFSYFVRPTNNCNTCPQW